jgi:heptosyltransferase-3
MTCAARALEVFLERVLHGRSPGAVPPFAPDRVKRILVVRNDNVGDLLCTTPALRALRQAFPEAYIAMLVPEHCRPVLSGNPDVDVAFSYVKSKHAPEWCGLPALMSLGGVIRDLRKRRFDLAIAMRRSFSRSCAWLAYASGAPWRLGYQRLPPHILNFFLNVGGLGHAPAYHEVDGCLELLATIGIPAAGRELTLVPDLGAQAAVRRHLAEAGAAGIAIIHISNRREASRWPLESFVAAADLIQEKLGLRIGLSWAPGNRGGPIFPGDDSQAEEVAQRMRTRPILLRTPTLHDLIAAVSLSDFVLSTDGGPMHIAAALDTPQVVIFGKTDPRGWTPVSEKSVLLQRGGRADQISVDEVVAAAVSVMSRWGRHTTVSGAGS